MGICAVLWEYDGSVCMRKIVNEQRIHGSVGRRGTGETTRLDNQTFTLPTVLLHCIQMWKAALQFSCKKLFIGLYWGMIPAAALWLPATEGVWLAGVKQLCPQGDLWSVKDSQINTLSIPDRIRGPHLHASLTHHTIFSQPCWVGFVEVIRRSWPHTPLPSGQAKGHYAFPEGLFGIQHLIAASFVEDWGQPRIRVSPSMLEIGFLLFLCCRKQTHYTSPALGVLAPHTASSFYIGSSILFFVFF